MARTAVRKLGKRVVWVFAAASLMVVGSATAQGDMLDDLWEELIATEEAYFACTADLHVLALDIQEQETYIALLTEGLREVMNADVPLGSYSRPIAELVRELQSAHQDLASLKVWQVVGICELEAFCNHMADLRAEIEELEGAQLQ